MSIAIACLQTIPNRRKIGLLAAVVVLTGVLIGRCVLNMRSLLLPIRIGSKLILNIFSQKVGMQFKKKLL